MYNRYIPEDISYTRLEPAQLSRKSPGGIKAGPSPRHQTPSRFSGITAGGEGLFGLLRGYENGLSGFMKNLHLDKIDSGDILLLLLALYLWKEGDDPDIVIALGLMLLMGLWDGEE